MLLASQPLQLPLQVRGEPQQKSNAEFGWSAAPARIRQPILPASTGPSLKSSDLQCNRVARQACLAPWPPG